MACGRITKEGNKYIRWVLIEAAQNASRYHPKLRGFYKRDAPIYCVLKRHEESHGQLDELLGKKTRRLERTVDSSLQAE